MHLPHLPWQLLICQHIYNNPPPVFTAPYCKTRRCSPSRSDFQPRVDTTHWQLLTDAEIDSWLLFVCSCHLPYTRRAAPREPHEQMGPRAFVYIQRICRSGAPRTPGCHGNWVSNMAGISGRNSTRGRARTSHPLSAVNPFGLSGRLAGGYREEKGKVIKHGWHSGRFSVRCWWAVLRSN